MNTSTKVNFTKSEAVSNKGMVATKDRLATQAGLEILKTGGNAIDAAVAACLAVGVVGPESSGIGGGGYMVFQMGDKGGVFGFPMKGPIEAKPDMYKLTGEPSVGSFGWPGVSDDENIHGFKSIAVPGCVAGLVEAHKRFGKLPLKEVVEPAVQIARKGYSPEWYALYKMAGLTQMLLRYEEIGKIFMPEGSLPFGGIDGPYILRQPELASSLEAIGKVGADAFYRGEITELMVKDIRNNGGIISKEDFDSYKPFYWENALEFNYRGKIIRVPPFACAGTTTAMTLKLLDRFNLTSLGHNSTETLHNYISAARMAYADRFEYMADPNFADVPWKGLVSDEYAARQSSQIGETAILNYEAGNPWIEEGRDPKFTMKGSNPSPDNGTTHLCVIDGQGNAVSITNTIMSGFGSGIVPKGTGIVMNNGMMWYDPVPGRVNSVAPGKYPLNNMTPALVLGSDGVEIAVGASGGRRITNCVSSLLIKMIDFNMNPQEAIDSPRIDCSSATTDVPPELDKKVVEDLRAKGHEIRILDEGFWQTGSSKFASPAAILKKNGLFYGGVDTFHTANAEGM